jgi:hypothetical protein
MYKQTAMTIDNLASKGSRKKQASSSTVIVMNPSTLNPGRAFVFLAPGLLNGFGLMAGEVKG